jgi:hypothetical protein
MSVKLMTTESIRDDLETIAITWPEGVPATQVDRVNALKAELKRRGDDADAPNGAPSKAKKLGRRSVKDMDRDELEAELRSLSKTGPGDEAAQERFANVRYELRSRLAAKKDLAEDELPPGPPPPPLPARQLELPDEDEMELARREREANDDRKVAERRAPRRTDDPRGAKIDARLAAKMELAEARRATDGPALRPALGDWKGGVNGYRAGAVELPGGAGIAGVSLEYERRSSHGVVRVDRQFTVEQADAFIAMFTMARDAAKVANLDKWVAKSGDED